MSTRVVHCRREKYDVYIGRPSKWGNPFVLAKADGNKAEARLAVIAKYEAWLREQPDLMASLHELRGKTLGCWCAPKSCHGDVLARLAEEAVRQALAEVDMDIEDVRAECSHAWETIGEAKPPFERCVRCYATRAK